MKIEYYHSSKYGNGALVAEEIKKHLAAKGNIVTIKHVNAAKASEVPTADLYFFSSPGRFGKPTSDMSKFLRKLSLSTGSKCAIVVTELAPDQTKKERKSPDKESGKCQQVIPAMSKILQEKGLVMIAQNKFYVSGIKGPLEEGWQKKAEDFAASIKI